MRFRGEGGRTHAWKRVLQNTKNGKRQLMRSNFFRLKTATAIAACQYTYCRFRQSLALAFFQIVKRRLPSCLRRAFQNSQLLMQIKLQISNWAYLVGTNKALSKGIFGNCFVLYAQRVYIPAICAKISNKRFQLSSCSNHHPIFNVSKALYKRQAV